MTARSVVTLVAVAALAAGCTSRTGGGESPTPEETREPYAAAAEELADMLAEAEDVAETLNTIDTADIEGSLDGWETVATGELLTEIQGNRAASVAALTAAGTSSAGEVVTAAASDFDSDDGTAEVLALVRIAITQPGAEPTEKQQRLRLTMTMTDDGWKAESVATVTAG